MGDSVCDMAKNAYINKYIKSSSSRRSSNWDCVIIKACEVEVVIDFTGLNFNAISKYLARN